MSTQLPPAGWQTDPQQPGQQRWWDGTAWSDHRRPTPSPAPPAPGTGGGGWPAETTGSQRLDRMLLPGEQVVVSASVHSGVAYLPAIATAVTALLFVVVAAGAGEAAGGMATAVTLLFLLAGPFALAGYLRLRTNHFALTSRRAVVTTGILRKTTREILVERIEGITVTQNLIDRVFGSGSLVVSGVGVGTVTIAGIEAAFEVRRRLVTWLEARRHDRPRLG